MLRASISLRSVEVDVYPRRCLSGVGVVVKTLAATADMVRALSRYRLQM
jgi:hypothetical protein